MATVAGPMKIVSFQTFQGMIFIDFFFCCLIPDTRCWACPANYEGLKDSRARLEQSKEGT
jgi:hypothetical protein